MVGRRVSIIIGLLASTVGVGAPTAAWSQQQQVYQFDLPAQDLGDALRAVAARAGWELYAPADLINGVNAAPLHGSLTVRQAIEQLLQGTNLTVRFAKGAVIIRGRPQPAAIANETGITADIVVTGTHLRHSEPADVVTSATREQIENNGQTDLGEYIRDLPQNFGGGSNPGIVGGGVQGGNENLSSTSALNLRGLGPDATLTLINGHRVAYDGAVQGVDISAIPLPALERIDIVADGASALYGSDAVGGVANVILRRDYEGLWTSARIGAATGGGDFQQQYSLVTGRKWGDGGFMLTGDFNRSTAVNADQRSVTQQLDGSTTLIPYQKQYSAVFNGHQQLAGWLDFTVDAQYSRRNSEYATPTTTTTDARTDGSVYFPSVTSYSATPSLNVSLPGNWRFNLSGTYSRSLTRAPGQTFTAGALASSSQVFYDNQFRSVEARADGTLFSLPGGDVALAAGGGYRGYSLDSKSGIVAGATTINILDIEHTENVAFAFGEMSVPIFGPANRRPLLDFLQLSGAVRYEHYANLASVASPKVGIVYRPDSSVTIKASWGRSFKAPTFYQRYKTYQALLINGSELGETGALANRPVLYLAGGNPDLKPERASTWNITGAYAPSAIPALHLQASYYHIKYNNRVVDPLSSVIGALENPIYQSLITYDPVPALLDHLIAPAGGAYGLQNFTGQPYDPSTVYAVLDARSQNSSRDTIQGVDMSAEYRLNLASGGHVDLNASATYTDARRRLIADEATVDASGVIFMPPRWRARGGAIFSQDNVTLSAFANYIDGVRDNRLAPMLWVRSFVTADLIARVSGGSAGFFRGFDWTVGISNLFNEKPARIRTSGVTEPTYDSTNYSILGRVINVTLTKRW